MCVVLFLTLSFREAQAEERQKKKQHWEELKASGGEAGASILNETAESVEHRSKKKNKKKPAPFGWEGK